MSKINDLKMMNIQKIRQCFYDGNIWTKNQLASETHLSLGSVTNILQDLLQSYEILFIGEDVSTGGRKSKKYQLNQHISHILKVVLKRTETSYIFDFQSVDLFNQLVDEKIMKTEYGTLEDFVNGIKSMIETDSLITMICVSIPGICHDGYIDVCDFEQLSECNLKEVLQKSFTQNIILENDINIASIGFYHRYQYQNLALIYQPRVKYVGCGMIIDGKLFNGFTHFAGELRFLPFYSHQEQNQLLEEKPIELLEKQIETLCCVLNPEVVGVCSDVIEDFTSLQLHAIPQVHRPKMIVVKDLYQLIEEGIYHVSLKTILENKGEKQ